jgi:hypothetical protein
LLGQLLYRLFHRALDPTILQTAGDDDRCAKPNEGAIRRSWAPVRAMWMLELLAAPAGRRLDRLGVERELRAVPGRALLLLGFRAGIRFVVDHDVAAFVRDEDVDAARPDLAVDPRGQRSLTRDRAAGER